MSALIALNHDLRTEYIADCQTGIKRWNRMLADARGRPAGCACRTSGSTARSGCSPGTTSPPTGDRRHATVGGAASPAWLPTEADKAHVRSLMRPVYEPGKIAGWIAPPRNGINDKPVDYEYVHLA